jgi:hypothetical protein
MHVETYRESLEKAGTAAPVLDADRVLQAERVSLRRDEPGDGNDGVTPNRDSG